MDWEAVKRKTDKLLAESAGLSPLEAELAKDLANLLAEREKLGKENEQLRARLAARQKQTLATKLQDALWE